MILDLLGLVIFLNVDCELLFLYKFKSFWFWQAKWSVMYNGVPLAADSVEVKLKKELLDIYVFHNDSIFKYAGFWNSYFAKINISWFDQVLPILTDFV